MSTQNKLFTIVEFVLDNGVEVVPSSWLTEEQNYCRFPNPIPRGFKRIQNDSSSIAREDWTLYEVGVVGSYGKSKNNYCDKKGRRY